MRAAFAKASASMANSTVTRGGELRSNSTGADGVSVSFLVRSDS